MEPRERGHDIAAERLRAYFAACLDRYGHDPRGVDWQSAEAQQARFAALMDVGDLRGASVLDAGCGFGDLYGYLEARGCAVTYTGCDLSAPHIDRARAAYPGARFVVGDAASLARRERFDYVLACGLLHLRVPRWQRWAWTTVRDLYAGCRRGLAFTLPDRNAEHPPVVAAVDPRDWQSRLRIICDGVEVRPVEGWGDVAFICTQRQPQ